MRRLAALPVVAFLLATTVTVGAPDANGRVAQSPAPTDSAVIAVNLDADAASDCGPTTATSRLIDDTSPGFEAEDELTIDVGSVDLGLAPQSVTWLTIECAGGDTATTEPGGGADPGGADDAVDAYVRGGVEGEGVEGPPSPVLAVAAAMALVGLLGVGVLIARSRRQAMRSARSSGAMNDEGGGGPQA